MQKTQGAAPRTVTAPVKDLSDDDATMTDSVVSNNSAIKMRLPKPSPRVGIRAAPKTVTASVKGPTDDASMTDLDAMLIGDGGTLIRTAVDDISTQGRDATGVRVMNVTDGHRVAAVARVLASDEDTQEEDGAIPDEMETTEEE